MTNEGSNLRNLARSWSDNKSIKPGVYNCLMTIANRIDAEMVKLPRDANGKPIHFGDTVFTNDDPGTSWCVRYIELRCDKEPSIGIESSGVNTYRPPSCLTHIRPDSLESIARDLEDWAEGNISGSAQSFADRIRKLADKEGDYGPF